MKAKPEKMILGPNFDEFFVFQDVCYFPSELVGMHNVVLIFCTNVKDVLGPKMYNN